MSVNLQHAEFMPIMVFPLPSPMSSLSSTENVQTSQLITEYDLSKVRETFKISQNKKKLSKILLLLQTRPYFSNKKIIFVRYRLHTTIRKQINMKWQTPYKMATLWASAISVRSVSTSKLTAQQHICWNQEGWWECHCRRKHHIAHQEHGDERGIFPPPTYQRRVRLAGQHRQRTIVISW